MTYSYFYDTDDFDEPPEGDKAHVVIIWITRYDDHFDDKNFIIVVA